MRVFVKLYANLVRHVAGTKPGVPFEMDVPEGTTLGELAIHLHIPPEEVRIAFVGGRVQPELWVLAPADEIGIFPPIGGG
jgi:molybdopterin converting factor small subunit